MRWHRAAASLLGLLCALTLAPVSADLTGAGNEAQAAASRCWQHTLQVVADIEADPPQAWLVVLFGGSRAREATVGDRHWTRQLRSQSGEHVVAYNLASSNQTFGEDRELVVHLPATSTLVLIGVDEGRFTKPQESRTVKLPSPAPVPADYQQHRYSVTHVLSTARKQELVSDWLRRRYPLFKRNHTADQRSLEELVETCLERGLHPVLVATPWNVDVIKGSFDKARRVWRSACKEVSQEYGIPFVESGTSVRLRNDEFYDLFHLVEPGRTKWQAWLSVETAALLREYAAADGVSGDDAPSDPAPGGEGEVAGLGIGLSIMIAGSPAG
jgi:hypothetical protein